MLPRPPSFIFLLLLGFAFRLAGAEPASPLPPAPPRPGGETGPTKVGYAVWIGDITRIDSAAQTFAANFVVILRWRDPQLAHAGPGAKRYALDDIWHPGLLIADESEAEDDSLPEVADVAPDGTATHRRRVVGSFSQALNLRAFPFDFDTFRVQFVVLGQRPQDIELAPDPAAIGIGLTGGVGISKDLTLQDWRVTATNSSVSPFRAVPGVELASFTVEFTAARRAHHFVIKVLTPLVLIVMMSWAVFWIPPNDAGTQMSVAVTAMLTLIAYRFAVDLDVPKLPYLTRLDAFILMSSVLVFLSLIEVLVTTRLAYVENKALALAIDRRCRWVFPLVFVACTLTTLVL